MLNGLSLSNLSNYSNHMKFIKYSAAQKIQQAKDNPAGLAISEKMRSQFRGDDMAVRNMRDSQSLGRTAEGALSQSHSILQRMRELSIQANNGLLTDTDRSHLQQEFVGLRDTLNGIGRDTQFNTKPLLDGSLQNQQTTTNGNGGSLQLSISGSLASQLGKDGITLADVDLQANPRDSLSIIDGAIQQISQSRGQLGATDNRLDKAINVGETQSLNIRSAESRIRDADIAKNAMELQKIQLMQQAYFKTQRMGIGMMGMNVNLLM